MSVKETVQMIAKACDDKQAENIVVLDMNEISLVADYFLICHATSTRQTQAIARAVRDVAAENNFTVKQMEGFEQGKWIVIDANGVLCHIFQEDERSFYNLERLWGDAARYPVEIGQEG